MTDPSQVAFDEEAIAKHLEKFLVADDNKGKNFVFHGMVLSSHVYCFAPSESLGRNFWTLVTMGMSGTVMDVPNQVPRAERKDFQRAEVRNVFMQSVS